jgi:hypothetical protein
VPCAAAYGGGEPGEHVLEARATDAAGNVGPVARHTWAITGPTVVTPAPRTEGPPGVIFVPQKLSLTVAKRSLATVLKSGLKVRLGCARTCRGTLVLRQGKKVLVRRTAAAGTATPKLPAAQRRALARTKKVTLTLTVTAPEAEPVTRTVALKR